MSYQTVSSMDVDDEVRRLQTENNALAEELTQCQADKEFVWSLWKRLQVASPDITQAVGMVVQREREKMEYKDRKVLNILQVKDDKMDELQKLLSSQSKELSSTLAKKMDLEDEISSLNADKDELQEKNRRIQAKVDDLELRSRDRQDIAKEVSKDLENELQELRQNYVKKDIAYKDLEKDKSDLVVIRESQRERITKLESDLEEMKKSHVNLKREHEETENLCQKYEHDIGGLETDVESKNKELEAIRKELRELWQTHNETNEHSRQQAELIRQLQGLQKDTQKMMKNQEDAYLMDTTSIQSMYTELSGKYQLLKTSEMELRSSLEKCKQTLKARDNTILELSIKLDEVLSGGKDMGTQAYVGSQDKEIQSYDTDPQIEFQIESMQTEMDDLRDRITAKNRKIQMLERPTRDPGFKPSLSSSPKPRAKRRSVSASPTRIPPGKALHRKLTNTETKLEDTEMILKIKLSELEELRRAHDRRLERLKALQTQHRLVKTQLKALEEEVHGAPKKRKKLRRSDPKSLQKEDSDGVWNELTYLKNENKNLNVERMNAQEELDTLRVQASQDAATIHELRKSLEDNREEMQFLLEEREQERSKSPPPDLSKDLDAANGQIESLENKLGVSQLEKKQLLQNKDALCVERRNLKSEVNTLKQQAAEKRMEIADLKREMLRLQREAKRRKKRKSGKTHLAKQYQKFLNKSIREMSAMFEDFDKEGWEEVSDSEELTQTEVTGTSTDTPTSSTLESLGQFIALAARQNTATMPTSTPAKPASPSRVTATQRRVESVDEHVKRMNKRNEPPVKDIPAAKATEIERRSIALSPIHFATSSHVVTKKSGGPNPNARQVSTLKQRITTLQREVSLLRSSKNVLTRKEEEQKRTLDQLESELSQTTQKLQSSRLTVQRLTMEVERLKADKVGLERQLEENSLDSSGLQAGHSDQEWASLQARLKISNSEASKQLTQIKQLKTDNVQLTEKIQQQQERVSHVERDLAQKRTLVEDARLKLKIAHENAQSDSEVMLEAEGKLKSMADTNTRYKKQLESFRNRLSAVTREKYENESKVIKLSEQIEKKVKQISELQKKNGDLHATVVELERTAKQQLHSLANQSEAAIQSTHIKMATLNSSIQEYSKFCRVFGHALLNSILQARGLLRQQKKRKSTESLQREQGVSLRKAHEQACAILNLSHSDLQDILSPRADSETSEDKDVSEEERRDQQWSERWQRLLKTKEGFALNLVELLMEKVEERSQLAVQLNET